MAVKQIFEEVESVRFAVCITAESGLARVIRKLVSLPVVQNLRQVARRENGATEILNRALRLTEATVDFRYENPSDMALTTYLLVLAERSLNLSTILAEAVAPIATCWWAPRVAAQILERRTVASGDASAISLKHTIAPVLEVEDRTIDSKESVLVSGLTVSSVRQSGTTVIANAFSISGTRDTAIRGSVHRLFPVQHRMSFEDAGLAEELISTVNPAIPSIRGKEFRIPEQA